MARAASFQRFLAELRRRDVFRVVTVYSAAAFVVIQAADVIFPRIPLPGWTVTLVVWLCLLGFPFAVVLAWVFERTPEGLKRTDDAEESEITAISAHPIRLRRTAAVAVLGLALLVAGGWWALQGPLAGGGSYDSIAVLPFEDLSGQEGDQYFADGLAEELLNALASVPGLRVAARTSSFTFRGRQADVREIGDALNVETVLEGSVRRQQDRLRVTAQLIDARSGFHLWSAEYDRASADVFRVQDEVAAAIVDALAIRMSGDAPERLYRGGTDDPVAYDLYLEGRQLWAERRVPDLRVAVRRFEAAIARDSSFALAWSGLADAIDALAWRVPEERVRVPEARYAAQRALVLDPQLAEGWASAGILALDFGRDWSFAELALRRAIQLRPSYSTAYRWLADVYRYSGRVSRAVEPGRRAIELDPLSGQALNGHALTLANLGDWTGARQLFDRVLEGDYGDSGTLMSMVSLGRQLALDADEAAERATRWARVAGWPDPAAAGVIGRAVLDPALSAEALALLDEMDAAGLNLFDLGEASAALGDADAALDRLERAAAAEYAAVVVAGTDPAWDPVRGEPRMVRLMAGFALPNGYDPTSDRD
jgi:adenylate cyclase